MRETQLKENIRYNRVFLGPDFYDIAQFLHLKPLKQTKTNQTKQQQ